MAELRYDDTQLQRMFAELDPKQRVRMFRGAFRRAAQVVRKRAIGNLRASIRSDRDLERGIRAVVFKRTAGFQVTIGTRRANRNGKGEAGFHTNRQGLKKPILLWAEGGTALRRTKTKTRIFKRSRKGHSTGRMKRYAFMRTTRDQVANSVTDNLHNEITNSVIRTAKKYGCI